MYFDCVYRILCIHLSHSRYVYIYVHNHMYKYSTLWTYVNIDMYVSTYMDYNIYSECDEHMLRMWGMVVAPPITCVQVEKEQHRILGAIWNNNALVRVYNCVIWQTPRVHQIYPHMPIIITHPYSYVCIYLHSNSLWLCMHMGIMHKAWVD